MLKIRELYDYLKEQDIVLSKRGVNINTKGMEDDIVSGMMLRSEYSDVLDEGIEILEYYRKLSGEKGRTIEYVRYAKDEMKLVQKDIGVDKDSYIRHYTNDYRKIHKELLERQIIHLLLNDTNKMIMYNLGFIRGSFDNSIQKVLLRTIEELASREMRTLSSFNREMEGMKNEYNRILKNIIDYKRQKGYTDKETEVAVRTVLDTKLQHGMLQPLKEIFEGNEKPIDIIRSKSIMEPFKKIRLEDFEEERIEEFILQYLKDMYERVKLVKPYNITDEELVLLMLLRENGDIQNIRKMLKDSEENIKELVVKVMVKDIERLNERISGRLK